MSEPQAAPPTDVRPDDAARKLRERVERLIAESAVRSQSSAGQGSARIDYETISEYLPVMATAIDKPADAQAAVFTIAYVQRTDPDAPASAAPRPVCFAFNGGPGSASIWLHLGALGPKRVAINDDGTMPEPPYAVVDNPHTWLRHFDLVFIDPPHTGYSVTASEDARKKMLAVDGDVDALAEVVRTWLARHRRWNSQVYIAGESYGTTRGAALADKLLDRGVALSGLVLVSCAMDLQTLVFNPGNDLPYALFLPGYACTAQYHGKLAGRLAASAQVAREEAQAYVFDTYLAALHRGASLTGNERSRVARRLAELTGLPREFVEHKNLRIRESDFFTHLLRAEGKVVGRLEARVTGPMGASRSHDWEFDPGIEAIVAPYTMASNAYFADTLGIRNEQRYEVLSLDVNRAWNWNRGEARGNGYACTSVDLARAMRRNPHMRVLVASGYYDLGTPYSATDWSLSQLNVPPEVMARITHHYYEAGHMMYTRQADLAKLATDLDAWLKA